MSAVFGRWARPVGVALVGVVVLCWVVGRGAVFRSGAVLLVVALLGSVGWCWALVRLEVEARL